MSVYSELKNFYQNMSINCGSFFRDSSELFQKLVQFERVEKEVGVPIGKDATPGNGFFIHRFVAYIGAFQSSIGGVSFKCAFFENGKMKNRHFEFEMFAHAGKNGLFYLNPQKNSRFEDIQDIASVEEIQKAALRTLEENDLKGWFLECVQMYLEKETFIENQMIAAMERLKAECLEKKNSIETKFQNLLNQLK